LLLSFIIIVFIINSRGGKGRWMADRRREMASRKRWEGKRQASLERIEEIREGKLFARVQ
jgi:hypothetical protein